MTAPVARSREIERLPVVPMVFSFRRWCADVRSSTVALLRGKPLRGALRVAVSRRPQRELDAEGCALPRAGVGGHAPTVRLGDRGDDREPEADAAARAGPRAVGAVEALEDVRRLLLVEARAGVGDGDLGVSVAAADRDAHGRSWGG